MPSVEKHSINTATVVIIIRKPSEYIFTLRNKSMTWHERITLNFIAFLSSWHSFRVENLENTDKKNLKLALNPITQK